MGRPAGAIGWRDGRRRDRSGVNDREIGQGTDRMHDMMKCEMRHSKRMKKKKRAGT